MAIKKKKMKQGQTTDVASLKPSQTAKGMGMGVESKKIIPGVKQVIGKAKMMKKPAMLGKSKKKKMKQENGR